MSTAFTAKGRFSATKGVMTPAACMASVTRRATPATAGFDIEVPDLPVWRSSSRSEAERGASFDFAE